MKPFSKGYGKDLKVLLYESSRHDFQNVCFQLLKITYPTIISAKDLGEIDSSGIDLYTRDVETKNLDIVFQCKGFELSEFSESQLQQCIKSIRKFINSTQHANKYYLIINRHIKVKELRDELQKSLNLVKASGKANSVVLLETNTLIEFSFSYVNKEILGVIKNKNEKFRKEYQERMGQGFYISDIPAKKDNKVFINPSRYIKEHVYVRKNKDTFSRSWTFIISEFGFGKTSLLLNLPELDDEKLYIYIPIAQMSSEVFTNQTTLSKGILSNLLEKEIDFSGKILHNLRDKLYSLSFTLLLRSNPNIVLLYDGLDEHHKSYDAKGLADIFNCASEFTCHSVFSVRKEFMDERYGNFSDAIGKMRKPRQANIYLTEWESEHILAFIDKIPSTNANLLEFKEVIKNKKYESYFGDIPRRPLFLKMLSDDIASSGIKNITLTELYEKYIVKKFSIDRETSVKNPRSGRLFREYGDKYKIANVLFNILTEISSTMIHYNASIAVLNESIDEKKVENAIKNHSSHIKEIIEIMLMSVLVPFEKRNITGFKAKFSHKSFQEFFTAKYLINLIDNENTELYENLSKSYTEGVNKFFNEFLEKRNIELSEPLRNYIKYNAFNKKSILSKIATFYSVTSEIKYINTCSEYDVFISHASEDKDDFVRPFAKLLSSMNIRVWYDEFNIEIGDSIRESIDKGLKNSNFGIVVLSHAFFSKTWAKKELNALFSLQTDSGNTLLPLLHGISASEVKSYSPLLSDILAVNTDIGIAEVANIITRKIKKA